VITFYCTQCWAEVPERAKICPRCGDDIAARQASADFVEKLIAALHHPEPTTPIRAAWILGEPGERKAVEPLLELARTSPDVFIVESAVEALGKIGDPRVSETLRLLAQNPNLRVRRAAERALARMEPPAPEDSADSHRCPYCESLTARRQEVEHSISHWPYVLTVSTIGWVCASCGETSYDPGANQFFERMANKLRAQDFCGLVSMGGDYFFTSYRPRRHGS